MLEKSLKTWKCQTDAIFFLLFSACSRVLVGGSRKGLWVLPALLNPTHGVDGPCCTSWPCWRTGAEQGPWCGPLVRGVRLNSCAIFQPFHACVKNCYITAQVLQPREIPAQLRHSANRMNNWVIFQCREGKSQAQPSGLLTNKIWIITQEGLVKLIFSDHKLSRSSELMGEGYSLISLGYLPNGGGGILNAFWSVGLFLVYFRMNTPCPSFWSVGAKQWQSTCMFWEISERDFSGKWIVGFAGEATFLQPFCTTGLKCTGNPLQLVGIFWSWTHF